MIPSYERMDASICTVTLLLLRIARMMALQMRLYAILLRFLTDTYEGWCTYPTKSSPVRSGAMRQLPFSVRWYRPNSLSTAFRTRCRKVLSGWRTTMSSM